MQYISYLHFEVNQVSLTNTSTIFLSSCLSKPSFNSNFISFCLNIIVFSIDRSGLNIELAFLFPICLKSISPNVSDFSNLSHPLNVVSGMPYSLANIV